MPAKRTTRRKRVKYPHAIQDLSTLTIKPRWWVEMHEPVTIEGYKTPDGTGIEASAEYNGVKYRGILYPVKDEHPH